MESLNQLVNTTYERALGLFIEDQWAIKLAMFVVILLFTYLLRKVISKWVFKILLKWTAKSKREWDDLLVGSFKKPLEYLVMCLGLYAALGALPLSTGANHVITLIFKAAFIIIIAFGVYQLEGFYGHVFSNIGSKLNVKRSNLLKQFTVRIFRVGTVVLAGVLVLDVFGFDISTFVAGLGLAGLAIALAAQDTLQNVFAGVTLIMDKPFDVGDRVLTNGIDGIVEDINFRSTRIRTLEREFVTIPNSNISNNEIVNFTKRDERKVKMTVGCMYSTQADQLKTVIDKTRQVLMGHDQIVNDSINVNLEGFGDSSINILVMYLTNTSDWNTYLTIREEVNFKIMTIMNEAGVDFAFPSQSIYFETPLKVEN